MTYLKKKIAIAINFSVVFYEFLSESEERASFPLYGLATDPLYYSNIILLLYFFLKNYNFSNSSTTHLESHLFNLSSGYSSLKQHPFLTPLDRFILYRSTIWDVDCHPYQYETALEFNQLFLM